MLSAWVWTIAPDVNVTSGRPVVSQTNGLVSGPQPNFFWHGYNYSESVEPSYIAVGVNSSRAPPISLQFTGLSPTSDYTVYGYYAGNGTNFYAQNYISNKTGVVNQTYAPSSMPLDPTFAIFPTPGGSGGGGPSPCTSNCSGVSPSPSGGGGGGFHWPAFPGLPAFSFQLFAGLIILALGIAVFIIAPGGRSKSVGVFFALIGAVVIVV